MEWSGRHRICRTQMENARILREEALELQARLEKRAERENQKLLEIPMIDSRSRLIPNDAVSGFDSPSYEREVAEELGSELHELLDNAEELKTLHKDGETYFHGFDFLQNCSDGCLTSVFSTHSDRA